MIMNSTTDIESSGIFPEESTPTESRDREAIRRLDHERRNQPLGFRLIAAVTEHDNLDSKRTFHKFTVLILTFITYSCYHLGRRPLSIVKNVLNRNCSSLPHPSTFRSNLDANSIIDYDYNDGSTSTTLIPVDPNWCDWAPFNNDATANELLAILDSAFLFSYAFFMFFSGFLADRCNIRYFLTFGLVASGVMLHAFGISYYLNIHSMSYFLLIQILSGAFHTTGWPTVVTCVGNWFGPSSRGLVFGIWNSHTNVGNILGASIAGYFVERAWGLSFIVPGFIMMACSIIVFLFLVPRPQDVGLAVENAQHNNINRSRQSNTDGGDTVEVIIHRDTQTTRRKIYKSDEDSANTDTDSGSGFINDSENRPLITGGSDHYEDVLFERGDERAASFKTCLKVPGVMEYSLCLFFSKLVSYTFLYWLPRYIKQSTLNDSENSAYLSTPFDMGGIFGAITAGFLNDRLGMSASICSLMLFFAIPAMYVYEKFAALSNIHNIVLQIIAGALVTGPYALITTTVSADLGSKVKNGKAMATVAAIIDGTGSIGAALGPLIAGLVSDKGWTMIFVMCMISDLLASLCLLRTALGEIKLKLLKTTNE